MQGESLMTTETTRVGKLTACQLRVCAISGNMGNCSISVGWLLPATFIKVLGERRIQARAPPSASTDRRRYSTLGDALCPRPLN